MQRIIDQSKALHKELETWFGQWQQLKQTISKTWTEFDRVASRYQNHVLPLIYGFGELDSTLVMKEKVLDLQPLGGVLLEERTEVSLVTEEERKEISASDKFTEPLNKEDAPVQS